MKNSIPLLVIVLISYGCLNKKPNNKIVDVHFNRTYRLESQPIKNTNIYCPNDHALIENYLLSVNLCHDTLINAIDLGKMESRYIIPKGKGPSEAIRLEYSGQIQKSGDITKAGFFDRSRKNFLWIDPQKVIKGSYRDIEVEKIPEKIGIGEDLFRTDDGWAGTDLSGDGLLFLYNENTNDTQWLDYEPKLSYRISDPRVKSHIYYSETKYNASLNKYICALRYFPLVHVINSRCQIEKTFRFKKKYDEPRIMREQGLPNDASPIYFWNVISTNSFIYILRANISVKEYKNGSLQNTSLYVVDWDGKGQCKIDFDSPVANIEIDFHNKLIYGISPKDLENPLVRIQIPDHLKQYFK